MLCHPKGPRYARAKLVMAIPSFYGPALVRKFLRTLLTLFCTVEPPQITEKPEVMKVTVGDPVSLDCKVTGSPELKVKWMKDGKELQSIRQHKLVFEHNISSLKIQSAQREDEGEYVFEVANHISSCSCRVKVVVLGWCEV